MVCQKLGENADCIIRYSKTTTVCLEILYWLLLFQIGLSQKQNLIHLVLHVLLVSQSFSLSHLSLCSKPLFAAISIPAVFSASVESTFMQRDCSGQPSQDNSLCEGFALWMHKDKPLVSSLFHPSPASIMHVCMHAHTHAGQWSRLILIAQGFVPYPSNQPAGGDGESVQLPNKALSELGERIPF